MTGENVDTTANFLQELDGLISAGQELRNSVRGDNTRIVVREMEKLDRQVRALLEDVPDVSVIAANFSTAFDRHQYLGGATAHHEAVLIRKGLDVMLTEMRAVRVASDQRVEMIDLTTPPMREHMEVFIVHGHSPKYHEVARFIEDKTNGQLRIMKEEAGSNASAIDRLERYATTAGFAVALLTGDDHGGGAGDRKSRKRARQNVILELGFFIAALGRNKVAMLCEDDVEQPSDVVGIIHIRLDPDGAWKMRLGDMLRDVGFSVQF